MIATNHNSQATYQRESLIRYSSRKANRSGIYRLARYIAETITKYGYDEKNVSMLREIGRDLQDYYGPAEYYHCGQSEWACGIDWKMDDEDEIGALAGIMYLRSQGYRLPSYDYDAIADALGMQAENIIGEVYGMVIAAAEEISTNGIQC